MGVKVAVSGKGGVGKTTIVGSMARLWARQGLKVIAVDADPAAHLHTVLEVPSESAPVAISSELDLIQERTGARPGTQSGPFYRLNPRVDDIPERYAATGADGVKLLVLGTIRTVGGGCFCPENAVLRGLLEHVILEKDEAVIVDMEAGLEQFGRATCRGVDLMIVVVEPGSKSIETAATIVGLSKEMGVRRTAVVANRLRTPAEKDAVARMLRERGLELAHAIPYSSAVAKAELLGLSPFTVKGASKWLESVRQLSNMVSRLSVSEG